jgi:hypothetical protein
MLQDQPFFFACNPHTVSFSLLPSPPPSTPSDPPLPPTISPLHPAKFYTATDVVHTLPAGLWDSKVVSTYEFTDLERGAFVRIRSPMGIVMDTVWTIQSEGEGLMLVEDITIRCSRLLMGVVKATCEAGWEGIHGKMVGRLRRETEGR